MGGGEEIEKVTAEAGTQPLPMGQTGKLRAVQELLLVVSLPHPSWHLNSLLLSQCKPPISIGKTLLSCTLT